MDTNRARAPGEGHPSPRLSRRGFVLASAALPLGISALVLAACQGQSGAPSSSITTAPTNAVATATGAARGGSSTPTAQPVAPSAAGAVSLRMSSSSHGAGTTFLDVMKNIAQEVSKANPSVTISPEFIPQNYHQKLTVAAAGNAAPDVIFFGAGKDMPAYMDKGFFADLGPYVSRSSSLKAEDFFPVDWQFCQWKGKQYGIPWGSGCAAIFYNKKLFDEANVPYPPTDWNDPKWTWDAFLETAMKLTKGSGATKTFGYAPNTWWVYTQPWIWANGAPGVLDANATKSLLRETRVSDAIQWIADLSQKHHVAPLPSEMGQGLQNMLTSNRVAMWEANTGQVPFVSTYKDFQWNVGAYPRGKDSPHPRNPVDSVTIWSGSKHADEAWKVVDFATSPNGLKLLTSYGEDIPSRVTVAESETFLRPNTSQHWKVFLDGVKIAREDPLTVIFPWMDRTINQEYNSNVLTGKETAAQMAAKLAPQIDAKLQAGTG